MSGLMSKCCLTCGMLSFSSQYRIGYSNLIVREIVVHIIQLFTAIADVISDVHHKNIITFIFADNKRNETFEFNKNSENSNYLEKLGKSAMKYTVCVYCLLILGSRSTT